MPKELRPPEANQKNAGPECLISFFGDMILFSTFFFDHFCILINIYAFYIKRI